MNIFPDKQQLPFFLLRYVILAGLFMLGGCFMMSMPGKSHTGTLPASTPEERMTAEHLKADVTMLADTIGERNTTCYPQLQQSAEYISSRFRQMGYVVREESYLVDGKSVSNIEAELKGNRQPDEIVLIGAHYDSPPGSPGANDNASGVAALLELANKFKNLKPGHTLRFVAFVNEELPYFQTDLMGSRVYAANARKRGDNIVAMFALETIGYYSDKPGSQQYPPPFNLFFPDTGNFIGIVGNLASRPLRTRQHPDFPGNDTISLGRIGCAKLYQGCGMVRSVVILAGGLSGNNDHRHRAVPLSALSRSFGYS